MLCLILIATLGAATNAQHCGRAIDYCNISADHIMCKYPSTDYATACGSPVYAGLNCDMEKQYILDMHNNIRRRVAKGLETRGNPGPQPPAANMRKLVWDEELARIAQRWTNQCGSAAHNLSSDVERFNVAANYRIVTHYPAQPNLWGSPYWNETVDRWYSWEVMFNWEDMFDSINVRRYEPEPTDAETSIVWADMYTIGCGFTGYFFENIYEKFYRCLYGPKGNIVGDNSSVYQIGPACSACPASATRCEDGLCV